MKEFIIQTFFLLLSFLLVFIWQLTILSQYTIQALGIFIALYLIISIRKKSFNLFNMMGESNWSIFILTSIILLIVFSTGGINSNLFFLLYFISFGIAFVFEPTAVYVFAVLVILVFLPDALKDDIMSNFLRIGSVALVSPLAYFFGREYRKEEQQEQKIQKLEKRIKH